MARRDWIRVRSKWWEDPDLDILTGAERRWGPFLMYLADSDPDWRETGVAWLLSSTGVPLSVEDLSKMGRARADVVRTLVAKLEAARVVIRRADGAYGLRNYRKHQENPATTWRRAKRGAIPVQSQCNGDAIAMQEPCTPEAEAEAEAEELTDAEVKQTIVVVDKTDVDPELSAASALLVELDRVRRDVEGRTKARLGPLSRKGSETLAGIADALREHDAATVLAVARRRAEDVAAGRAPVAFWRCLFHGNGFEAAFDAHAEADQHKRAERVRAAADEERRAVKAARENKHQRAAESVAAKITEELSTLAKGKEAP